MSSTRPRLMNQKWLLPAARWLVTTVLLYAGGVSAFAQSVTADEYEIRAAMLFNLTKFVEWPASKLDQAHPQFVVCLLGADPIGSDLENFLRDKSVETKPVIVRHLNSVDMAGVCHVLYVGSNERKSLARALPELIRNNVLTISERSNSNSPDQVIGLPTVDERVRIDVNISSALRSGLVISSKLLNLSVVFH